MIELNQKDIERFWSHVDIRGENDCWNWMAATSPSGYGKFSVRRNNKPKFLVTSRISFFLYHGFITKLFVCHFCDNKLCVNPKHLWLGTNRDNQRDYVEKFRSDHLIVYDPEKVINHNFEENIIIKIRELCQDKQITQEEISKMFGVSSSTISDIALGITWKNIGGPISSKKKRNISDSEGEKIIDFYNTGDYTYKEIGKLLGINSTTVASTIRKKIDL